MCFHFQARSSISIKDFVCLMIRPMVRPYDEILQNLLTSKTGYVEIASRLVWYQPCLFAKLPYLFVFHVDSKNYLIFQIW